MHGAELAVTSKGPWRGRSKPFLRTREETRSCLHWFAKLENCSLCENHFEKVVLRSNMEYCMDCPVVGIQSHFCQKLVLNSFSLLCSQV